MKLNKLETHKTESVTPGTRRSMQSSVLSTSRFKRKNPESSGIADEGTSIPATSIP